MAVITREQLENAAEDAADLAAFVNDAPGTVTPREGEPYPNLRQIVADAKFQVYGAASWTDLAAITPPEAHAVAEVLEDAGTHTDPVTDATVQNEGRYAFVAGDGNGWTRIGDSSSAVAIAAFKDSVNFVDDYYEGASFVFANDNGPQAYIDEITGGYISGANNSPLDATDYWEGYSFVIVNSQGQALVAIEGTGEEDNSGLERRINVSLDTAGFPLDQDLFGGGYLREFMWRYQLIREQTPLDGAVPSLVFAHIGDSYSLNDLYTTMEGRELRKPIAQGGLGNGGPGFLGFGFPPSLDGNTNTAKRDNAIGNIDTYFADSGARVPGEVDFVFTGSSWAGRYTVNQYSPNLSAARSATALDAINVTYTGTDTLATVALDYTVNDGTGAIEYRWNNTGTWNTVNLTGSGGASVALAGIPAGGWVLNIRVKAGSGVAELNGLNLLTGQAGAVIHMLANNGSAARHWAFLDYGTPGVAMRAAHAAAMARLGVINLFSCLLGTNDQLATDYPVYAVAMGTLIDQQLRPASPGADILWQIAPENGRPLDVAIYRMAGFFNAALPVAKEKKVALLNLQRFFGSTFPEYGSTGTLRKTFQNDNLHPNNAGGAIIRTARRNALHHRS